MILQFQCFDSPFNVNSSKCIRLQSIKKLFKQIVLLFLILQIMFLQEIIQTKLQISKYLLILCLFNLIYIQSIIFDFADYVCSRTSMKVLVKKNCLAGKSNRLINHFVIVILKNWYHLIWSLLNLLFRMEMICLCDGNYVH